MRVTRHDDMMTLGQSLLEHTGLEGVNLLTAVRLEPNG